MTRQTWRAVAADTTEPFDANTIADFDTTAFRSRAELDHLSDSFMTTDLIWLCGVRQRDPAIGHDTKVRVADSRVCAVIELVSLVALVTWSPS